MSVLVSTVSLWSRKAVLKADKSIYIFLFYHCMYMNVSMIRSNKMHLNIVPKTVGFAKFGYSLPNFSYVASHGMYIHRYMQQ